MWGMARGENVLMEGSPGWGPRAQFLLILSQPEYGVRSGNIVS